MRDPNEVDLSEKWAVFACIALSIWAIYVALDSEYLIP